MDITHPIHVYEHSMAIEANVEVTPKGLIIKQVIGSTSSTSQNPHVNQILTMQLFED